MARFFGTVKGGRGMASRIGHRHLTVRAQTWHGHIHVYLFLHRSGEEWVNVVLVDKDGTEHTLYKGLVAEYRDPLGEPIRLWPPGEGVTGDP